jgi:hypothetical protein
MTAATEAPTTYRVTGAYVTVKCPGNMLPGAKGAYTVMGFYRDAILPPGVEPTDLERLLNASFIEAVPAADEVA